MRSPLIWFGGKGIFAAKIIPLIPPHVTYVEVFGGGASLLFAKSISQVEVYNDLDHNLVNFFRVIRDPETFKEFQRKVELTPYSREEYYYFKKTWDSVDLSDTVERAYRWYMVVRMSFSGSFTGGWSYSVNDGRMCMSKSVSEYLGAVANLPKVHQRIRTLQVDCRDFREILKFYDAEKTLFYLDPPYVEETRRNGGYRCELTFEDHKDLVNILLKIKGMVILSGYNHSVYTPLEENGWVRKDFDTVCFASKSKGVDSRVEKQKRIESIWLSPKAVSCKRRTLWDNVEV